MAHWGGSHWPGQASQFQSGLIGATCCKCNPDTFWQNINAQCQKMSTGLLDNLLDNCPLHHVWNIFAMFGLIFSLVWKGCCQIWLGAANWAMRAGHCLGKFNFQVRTPTPFLKENGVLAPMPCLAPLGFECPFWLGAWQMHPIFRGRPPTLGGHRATELACRLPKDGKKPPKSQL